eukprot:Clim_evm25s145 gene=Clim_evmTU25s145
MAAIVVVTGAGQGFGQAIACAMAAQFRARGSTGFRVIFRLTAQSEDGLKQTKDLVLRMIPDASVYTKCIDLNNPGEYEPGLKQLLTDGVLGHIGSAYLFNFDSSVGDLSKSIDEYDLELIRGYLDLNFSSFTFLTKLFVEQFRSRVSRQMHIVNLSSICAVAEFPGYGLYCAIKASRDMFLKVLNRELEEYKLETGNMAVLKTLNYASGPLETSPHVTTYTNLKYEIMRNQFKDIHVIKCLTSADRLLKLMDTDYTSGLHIDYYDEF